MELQSTKSVAFVRFTSHDNTAGHFESLRLSQVEAAASNGITLHFWDLSEFSSSESLEKFALLGEQFAIGHIYCEWLHDIPDIQIVDTLVGKLKVKWSVLASISELWNKKQDLVFQKKISDLNECLNLSAVFVWDGYAVHNLPSYRIPFITIPDSQSVQIDTQEYSCCSWITKRDAVTIGIVGQLYGYRGTSALIQLATRQPGLRYIFWGTGRWSTVKIRHRFLRSILQQLNIIYVNDSFKSSDEELNHGFKHLDAVFLDGSQYPNPSGIVTRARHFGIPALINSGVGYYQFQSKIDKGLRIVEIQKLTKAEICQEISAGKKFGNVGTISGCEQAKIFMQAWKEPDELR